MIVAAGPFFSETSPHGQFLKSLIQKTIEFEAKLLILLGPIFETDFGTQLNNASTENIQNCYDDVLESILKSMFRFVFLYNPYNSFWSLVTVLTFDLEL